MSVSSAHHQILTLLLSLTPAIGHAQTAVANHNLALHTGPSSKTTVLANLAPQDEMTLIVGTPTHGYYEVRLPNGGLGWAYGKYISIDTSGTGSSRGGPSSGASGQPPEGGPPETYRGCDLEGTATSEKFRALNVLKNRITQPGSADIDRGATLNAILAPGSDSTRWSETKGASVVAYVAEVKHGAVETVNCGDSLQPYEDTHIELVGQAADAGVKNPVIAEVTPRWRDYMKGKSHDWSTPTLRATLRHHWVRFTGWLMKDFQHAGQADNTNPGGVGAGNWRATAWEIHPITDFKLCPNDSPAGC
ncbi:MAG TPA: SH3 domain-containing protein [Gemmatimonadales bacterium]|nr:SH3 domain-containing protein [Gemmatimonadales bacterium]